MPFGLALPLLASGIGSVFGAIGGKKRADAAAENELINFENRITADLLQRKNVDPFEPFGKLTRGRLFGSIAKAWGLDKIVGSEIIEHIGNTQNVPGTEAIGGAAYSVDPTTYGLPQFQKPKTGGSLLSAIGGVFGGAAQGLGSLYPTGGGSAGRVPGGLPQGYDTSSLDTEDFYA